jgi:hypothetical protein
MTSDRPPIPEPCPILSPNQPMRVPVGVDVSERIAECSSYLSLYNFLNGLTDSMDQHSAVLQITQYICVSQPSSTPDLTSSFRTHLHLSRVGIKLF